MTQTKNGGGRASQRHGSNRNSRQQPRRREEHVIRTLERITPAYLAPQHRMQARAIAIFPLIMLIAGIALLAIHSSVPLGVVGVGIVLVVIGAIWSLMNLRIGSVKRIISTLPALWSDPEATDRLMNLLEGLCVQNGVSLPRVHLLKDDAQNAAVFGWTEKDAVLVLTTGMLEGRNRIELEGVIAHELAHIKRGDMRDSSFAYLGCGALAALSPGTARLVDRLLAPCRQADSDMGGASMTRYPPGLMQALAKISVAPTRPRGLKNTTVRLTASNWLVPLSESTPAKVRAGELDLAERIGLLAEL